MLVTLGLFPDCAVSIDVPSGWTVVANEDEGLLFALLGGHVQGQWEGVIVECDADRWALARFAWTTARLEDHAAAQMRRYVAQGEPERYADRVVDGHAAFGYAWTDGVSDNATWFVDVGPGQGARLDYTRAGGFAASPESTSRAAANRLIAELRWRDPRVA